jgi:histidinol-phosphatase
MASDTGGTRYGRGGIGRSVQVMRSPHTDDLRLAHVLADDADSLTMSRFKALDLHVESKPDLTPVSDADRSVEAAIRRTLGRARPRDAILGEEHGSSGWGPRRWIIDPIDGTKNFVRGVPVWATLIALMIEDDVVVGLVSAPALGRRWWAAQDDGAWSGRSIMNGQRCRVSDVAGLGDASLSYSSFDDWEAQGRLEDLLSLGRRCWRTRAYGDFWSHVLVAEGAVDIAVEPILELYDMAAIAVIVEEAGGRFTSLAGQRGPHGGNGLSTNGRLHEQALSYVGGLPAGDDPDEPTPVSGSVHRLPSRTHPASRED